MLKRYERLEIALNQRGLSFRTLWQRGLITRYTYYQVHRDGDVKTSELAAIARALGITYDELLALID